MSEIADFFKGLLEYAAMLRWLLFVAFVWIVYRVIANAEDVEWADFIGTIGVDGKYHGDWDKVGKGAAVVIGSVALVAILPGAQKDMGGFAIVLTTYFTFTGAVAGWAAYLRSKVGREEKVTVTEPMPRGPVKTTVTETGPAPPKDTAPVPVEIVNGAGIQKPLSVKQTDDNPEKEKP